MKKTLCLTAVMLSVFAFSGTANALQADTAVQSYKVNEEVFTYEGGGGGGTIIGNSCLSTCGGASTQSACQAGGYVCTQSSGSCWCPTGTPLRSGTVINRFDDGNLVAIEADIGAIVDDGSGSGTTKKVSGNCPEGTSLSSDKCCCVAN